MAHRLSKLGINVQRQFPLPVYDEDGTLLGDYYADLWIESRLVVELKACKELKEEHTAQVLSYLKSSGIEDALLVNFGSYKFQIRKYALSRTS